MNLDTPFDLDPACVAELALKGHTCVRGLATPAEVEAFRGPIEEHIARRSAKAPAMEDRSTYDKAFLQLHNLWQRDERVAPFTTSARFASVAARLLGVDGVRLYHDQALAKEPGGGHTPWHQDQVYWPFSTDRTITMWMPLVDVPAEIGTMTFANGSHRLGSMGPEAISDESEVAFDKAVAEAGLTTETHGPLAAGDATFHLGWTMHRAPANPTDRWRPVMTVIWFADGATVGPVDSIYRQLDHQVWLSAIPEGDPAAGPLNPVLWPPTTDR